jgi:proline iminopeptidase
MSTPARPFHVLGVQQIAVGGLDKTRLAKLWCDLFGADPRGTYRSEKENVDEDILTLGVKPWEVEIDLMQPIDAAGKPRVHDPALNHVGLWVDDLRVATEWLGARGVRFTPGGIRRGAAGYDVCFIHPKGDDAHPQGGEGVLVELVQAPPELVKRWHESRRRTLYPAVEPHEVGRLRVSDVHELYYEVSGNPKGKPVVFLHGGPGGGTDPVQRRFFDPARYRIVLFDQRGCGKSTPHASLVDNTTWHLVADIERLRAHLGVDRWQVFGGSWGSTLALAYAQAHPDRVTELVLRGIFLLRRSELEWFYQAGADQIFPDAWEPYRDHIPEVERGDLISAYHRRLTSDDATIRLEAAKVWSIWEAGTSFLRQKLDYVARAGEDEFSLAFSRIECHYFVNGGFFTREGQLLHDVDRIRHIPAVIVQGRYDVVCPMRSAWDLHRAWPEARLEVIPDSGHSAFETGIVDALVRATDEFASRS